MTGSVRRVDRNGRVARGGAGGGAAGVLVFLLAVVCLSGAAWGADLQREIEGVLGRVKAGPVRVGVCVQDSDSGTPLAGIRDNEAFIPASNMKLLTAGSALLVLGSDFEFRTSLIFRDGRLILEGSGDPALADPRLLDEMKIGVDAFLDHLVDAAAAAGVAGVREVVVDDRVFDREYVHPEWPRDQLNEWYCAQVGGVNFHANVLQIFASPGEREGEPPSLRTSPAAPWLEVVNRARTIRSGSPTIGAMRDGDRGRYLVMGSLRGALERPIEVTVHESSTFLGRLLAERVGAAGLGAGGGAPPSRLAEPDEDLGAGGATIAVVRTPLAVALARCNADSHNMYAEALLKRIGHETTGQPGAWGNGTAVVRMQVREKLGPNAAASIIVNDGSGLSRQNRVTPALMTAWLTAMNRDKRVAAAFVASLPQAGMEGTLARRFRGVNLGNEVRAKSGFINGVRCLSGYVTNVETGRRVSFSILTNDSGAGVSGTKVRQLQEEVVAVIDRWVARRAEAELGAQAVGG